MVPSKSILSKLAEISLPLSNTNVVTFCILVYCLPLPSHKTMITTVQIDYRNKMELCNAHRRMSKLSHQEIWKGAVKAILNFDLNLVSL